MNNEGLVKIDYFGFSKCSDYVSLEEQLVNIPAELDNLYDLNLYFYAKEDSDATYGFKCSHGDTECLGNFASACAIKLSNGNRTQWLKFTQCENNNFTAVPDNQDACAQSAGLDVDALHACITNDGPSLLLNGINRATALGVQWSPTLYFNDVQECQWNYAPCNTPLGVPDFTKKICSLYSGSLPLPPICTPKSDGRVKVDYYGYSKCSDYVSLEKELVQIPSELDGLYELNLYFYAKLDLDTDIKFKCLHGDGECLGNFASACAIKLSNGNRTRWLKFTQCENSNFTAVPDNQDACAKSAGLNVDALHSCISSSGFNLVLDGTNRATALGVQWSPTLYFNDVEECKWNADECNTPQGATDFTKLICTEYAGSQPLPSVCGSDTDTASSKKPGLSSGAIVAIIVVVVVVVAAVAVLLITIACKHRANSRLSSSSSHPVVESKKRKGSSLIESYDGYISS